MKKTKRRPFRKQTLNQIEKTIPRICTLAGAVAAFKVALIRDGRFFVTRTDAGDSTEQFTSTHRGMRNARVYVRPSLDTLDLVVAGKTGHVARNSLNRAIYQEVIKQMSMRAVTGLVCRAIESDPALAANADHVLKEVGTYLSFPLTNAETTCASEEKYKWLYALIVKPQDKERAKRITRRNVELARRAIKVLKKNPSATFKPI